MDVFFPHIWKKVLSFYMFWPIPRLEFWFDVFFPTYHQQRFLTHVWTIGLQWPSAEHRGHQSGTWTGSLGWLHHNHLESTSVNQLSVTQLVEPRPIGGFHNEGTPICLVNNANPSIHEWFRGTPILGNPQFVINPTQSVAGMCLVVSLVVIQTDGWWTDWLTSRMKPTYSLPNQPFAAQTCEICDVHHDIFWKPMETLFL